MRIITIICCLVLWSCNQEQKELLQSNVIRLSPPKITVNNAIIDSFVIVKADLKLDQTNVHFTTNGKTPDTSSEVYTNPIKVSKSGHFKFRAFHPDWNPSDVSSLNLFSKGVLVDRLITHTKPSKQYKGQGQNTLINNKKAPLHFRNEQWVGYDTIAKATVVLKEKKHIKSLTICYLTDMASWIFPPSHVSVLIDKNEVSKKEITIEVPKMFSSSSMGSIVIPIDIEVKSLNIEISNLQNIPKWHEGSGKKAWLFMDEWILNE